MPKVDSDYMDLFKRRFDGAQGGAKDLYAVRQHVKTRRTFAPRGSFAWLCGLLATGPYTSVGSYPVYFATARGEVLSWRSVRENLLHIGRQTSRRGHDPRYRVVECNVNYEDPQLYCFESDERIESAHAEDDRDSVCAKHATGDTGPCRYCEQDDE